MRPAAPPQSGAIETGHTSVAQSTPQQSRRTHQRTPMQSGVASRSQPGIQEKQGSQHSSSSGPQMASQNASQHTQQSSSSIRGRARRQTAAACAMQSSGGSSWAYAYDAVQEQPPPLRCAPTLPIKDAIDMQLITLQNCRGKWQVQVQTPTFVFVARARRWDSSSAAVRVLCVFGAAAHAPAA